MPASSQYKDLPVVYFDGVCNFCYGLIKLLKKTGIEQKVHLVPFQMVSTQAPDELVYISESNFYPAEQAMIQLLKTMGGIFHFTALILQSLPAWLIRKIYYAVARNRYLLFGRRSCSLH